MRPVVIVRAITVICSGLVAGHFCRLSRERPARSALSASSFVQHQQAVPVYYVWMMPALILAALLAGLTWLWLVRSQWRGAEFRLVAASTVGMLFVVMVTRAVNVPLNNQLMTWSIATPPSNLRELWATWEGAHLIRTTAAVVALFSRSWR